MKQEDHVRADYLRTMAVDYGMRFIGVPYMWGAAPIPGLPGQVAGGDDPIAGFDCSGFVCEVLQAVGILPHNWRRSAAGLYELFKPNVVAAGYAGCLAFWFKDGRASHVMLMVDTERVIGASGGGSSTDTPAEAIRDNAFIKLRPLTYRKDTAVIIDPFRHLEK